MHPDYILQIWVNIVQFPIQKFYRFKFLKIIFTDGQDANAVSAIEVCEETETVFNCWQPKNAQPQCLLRCLE